MEIPPGVYRLRVVVELERERDALKEEVERLRALLEGPR